jgi:hypothetical protein
MLSRSFRPDRVQYAQHKLLFASIPPCWFLHQALGKSRQHFNRSREAVTFCRARSSSSTLIWDRKLASASSNVPAWESVRISALIKSDQRTGRLADPLEYCSLNNLSWFLINCLALTYFSCVVLTDSFKVIISSCIAMSLCLTSSGRSLPARVARRSLDA